MRSIYIMYKLQQNTFGEEVIHHSIMLCSNPIRWNCTKYETGSNWPIWTDLSVLRVILCLFRKCTAGPFYLVVFKVHFRIMNSTLCSKVSREWSDSLRQKYGFTTVKLSSVHTFFSFSKYIQNWSLALLHFGSQTLVELHAK